VWLKFHINTRSYECPSLSILVEGGSTLYVFLQLFFAIFDISKPFCRHYEPFEWYFVSPMCLYSSFEGLYNFDSFHLSRFSNQISPPSVLLGKFQHPFSTLKHYTKSCNLHGQMTLNLFHVIYNTYTSRLYSWDSYTFMTFRPITLQKQ